MHRRLQMGTLVFIAAVLLALLIGAVVKVREQSQMYTCSSQLKRIVAASHRYHDDYHCLPPGYVGPWPDRAGVDRAPHAGLLVYLLPYMIHEKASWVTPYYQLDLKAETDPQEKARSYTPAADAAWWQLSHPTTGIANTIMARQQFDFLQCPSMPVLPPQEGIIVAMHPYGKDEFKEGFLQRHVLTTKDDPSINSWGVTHYLGVSGRMGIGDKFEGVFTNRSKLTLGEVTVKDGTSETIAFGEACGEFESDASTRRTAYSWFCGSLPTYYGVSQPSRMAWYGFNGPHRQGIYFAYADGHVGLFKRDGVEESMGVDDGIPVPWKMEGDSSKQHSLRWLMLQCMAGYKDGIHYGPANFVD